jgi:predicted NAD/FAD-dependent oxidoreductase
MHAVGDVHLGAFDDPLIALASGGGAHAGHVRASTWLADANLWQSRFAALPQAGRQLMRWGAAFPLPPGLPTELMVCPQSKVAFCGDYLAGEGFGRLEGALRSGEALARNLNLQDLG